jgi:hypothetical protein
MKEHLIESESAAGWIEDNIIFYIFKSRKIDLFEARQSVEIKTKIAGTKSYPFFIDISQVNGVTKEAREYLAGGKSIDNISAAALLASSVLSKMIGTFFLTFNNPGIPVKLFTDEQEALKWLGKFVEQSETKGK